MDQESIQPTPISSESMPVNPIQPSPKSKLPMILLVVLLLILFIGVGVVLGKVLFTSSTTPSVEKIILPTPTTTQTLVTPTVVNNLTANWKTYVNTKYGYSLKYPNVWFIKNMTNIIAAPNILDAQYLNDSIQIDQVQYKISIMVDTANIDESKMRLNYGDAGNQNSAETSTLTNQGREIVKAIVTTSETDPTTNTLIERGKTYRILIPLGINTLNIVSNIQYKEITDQILSTFKFIQ